MEFQIYPVAEDLESLLDPMQYVWALIKHLRVRDVSMTLLHDTHGIKKQHELEAAADNIALYIDQAYELYEAGQGAKTSTASLYYYYCFLNLAKARCEMVFPRFHKRAENYHHGLTWNPNPNYLVNIKSESIRATTRGVWHALYESITGKSCPIRNPSVIRIIDLFSMCPEICDELELSTGRILKTISLDDPSIMVNSSYKKAWIKFSVDPDDVKQCRLSKNRLLMLLSGNPNDYKQVKSEQASLWTFELKRKIPIPLRGEPFQAVNDYIKSMNLFTFLGKDGIRYMIPIQNKLPIMMPQLIVLYTLMFWLGSLVRYDPASIRDLQTSREWLLLDGFQTQSRLWLLILFLWEFYQKEIIMTKSL